MYTKDKKYTATTKKTSSAGKNDIERNCRQYASSDRRSDRLVGEYAELVQNIKKIQRIQEQGLGVR